jgi:hypothetical protein
MPLPLAPVFTHFEDPEYNRGLVSMTAYAEGVWVDTKPATPVPHRIRLALDRREYNADSRFFAVYVDEGAAKLAAASLQVQAIRADGVPINLGAPLSMAESTLQLPADQVSIAAFYQRANPNLRPVPGDIVACTLYPDDTSLDAIVVVEVTVVADPVTPTPQAAYALLRKTGTAVACTRFAWSPIATRIELINPGDLLGETVRRRAVFAWTDTDRAMRDSQYAVQKLSATGSTHTIEDDAWEPQPIAN